MQLGVRPHLQRRVAFGDAALLVSPLNVSAMAEADQTVGQRPGSLRRVAARRKPRNSAPEIYRQRLADTYRKVGVEIGGADFARARRGAWCRRRLSAHIPRQRDGQRGNHRHCERSRGAANMKIDDLASLRNPNVEIAYHLELGFTQKSGIAHEYFYSFLHAR